MTKRQICPVRSFVRTYGGNPGDKFGQKNILFMILIEEFLTEKT
jgi:hypothetical protein